MCTAFPFGRSRERRLQGLDYASNTSGSFGGGPQALRLERLQWLTNITTGFKIAAFLTQVWVQSLFQNSVSGPGLAGTFPSIVLSIPESGVQLR